MHADFSRFSMLVSARISNDLRPVENCQVAGLHNSNFGTGLWRIVERPEGVILARFASDTSERADPASEDTLLVLQVDASAT